MKNKKAFTLLELLVAMAIIAILIALAIFGILQVQKNSRETQRRKALEDINIGVQDYYSRYGQYPNLIEFSTDEAAICEGTSTCPTTAGSQVVTVPLSNSAKAATSTTTNQTHYNYVLVDDGYKIAFCTEDDEAVNAGTASLDLAAGASDTATTIKCP